MRVEANEDESTEGCSEDETSSGDDHFENKENN